MSFYGRMTPDLVPGKKEASLGRNSPVSPHRTGRNSPQLTGRNSPQLTESTSPVTRTRKMSRKKTSSPLGGKSTKPRGFGLSGASPSRMTLTAAAPSRMTLTGASPSRMALVGQAPSKMALGGPSLPGSSFSRTNLGTASSRADLLGMAVGRFKAGLGGKSVLQRRPLGSRMNLLGDKGGGQCLDCGSKNVKTGGPQTRPPPKKTYKTMASLEEDGDSGEEGSDKESDEPPFIFTISSCVRDTIDKVARARIYREQTDIANKLHAIHKRVKTVYRQWDVKEDIHPTESEKQLVLDIGNRPPNYMSKEKRERQKKKRQSLKAIDEFIKHSATQRNILAETSDWLNASEGLLDEFDDEDDPEQKERTMNQLHRRIVMAILTAQNCVQKLQRLGESIFSDTGEPQGEGQRASAPRARRLPAGQQRVLQEGEVLDEETILADPENWRAAANQVRKVLQDATKMARTNKARNEVRDAIKQFDFISAAVDRRADELRERDSQIVDLKAEIDRLNNSKDRMAEEYNSLKKKCTQFKQLGDRLGLKVKETEGRVKLAETKAEEVAQSLAAAQAENTTLAKQLENQQQKWAMFENMRAEESKKPSGPSSSTMLLMDQQAGQLRETVDQLKAALDQRDKELATLREQAEIHNRMQGSAPPRPDSRNAGVQADMLEKFDQKEEAYKLQIESLQEEVSGLQEEVQELRRDLQMKNELLQMQEQELQEPDIGTSEPPEVVTTPGGTEAVAPKKTRRGAREQSPKKINPAAAANQMVSRITLQYEAEMRKTQSHIQMEKARFDAGLRKIRLEQGKDLGDVDRECRHIVYTINRFKEAIVQILQKEDLPEQALEVKQISDLSLGQASQRSLRSLITQLGKDVVEMLVSLEFKLAKALMNKRLKIKEAATGKSLVAKDLEAQAAHAQRLKREVMTQEARVKFARDQLEGAEKELAMSKMSQSEKYHSLLARYRDMSGAQEKLTEQLQKKQQLFVEELKMKDSRIQLLTDVRQELEKQLEQQNHIIREIKDRVWVNKDKAEESLFRNIHQQSAALREMEKLFTDQSVAEEIRFLMVDVMRMTRQIPELRLKHLCERYIAHCRFQQEKARLKRQAAAATRELRRDVEEFLVGMEERLQTSHGRWLNKKAELEAERQALFTQMVGLYQDVAWAMWLTGGQRTGAYTPLSFRTLRSSTPGGTRRHRKEGVFLRPIGDDDVLIGRNMVITSVEDDQYWNTSATGAAPMGVMVTTPTMLSMDVNQSMDSAKKTFRRHFPQTTTKGKEDGDSISSLSITEGRQSRFHGTGPSSQPSQPKRQPVLPPVATLCPAPSPDAAEWMEYPLPCHQQNLV
ncbi:coiled-coil domain-containing protein 186-like isoform X1 [Branchiostoma floridae]|uniref:Coiled-coil domain-containing protein 186-like isoform X1 n=2 Tax=Branchiostoma floridae TaxID=7739 RepID=A0A9J7KQ87_BRAFL|nr:coiled-coil domain-containing protein 186-like isoform X1 [Branchiostoma floridae]